MHKRVEFGTWAKSLVLVWAALFFLAGYTAYGPLAIFTICLTGALPFILAVLWIGLSRPGERLRATLANWHVRVFWLTGLFCYGLYGRKWSGDLINEIFHVDSKYFGVTSTVLTVLFTPFGLIYHDHMFGNFRDLFIVGAVIVCPLYWLYIAAPGTTARTKKVIVSVFFIVLGAGALTMDVGLAQSFKPFVKSFAVWADFNKQHPCTDPWASRADGVVFLDDGKVLAYFPSADDKKFQILSCDYAMTFN